MMPCTNYSKNVWSVISLSLLLFSVSFLAHSDETTSNAYETTNSTNASTESDVNTYDVNSSDVNFPDVNNSDITISETLTMNSLPSSADVESTRKSFWYPSPQALLWKIQSGSTGFILFLHFFSLIFFKDNICFKTNVHCVWQMSTKTYLRFNIPKFSSSAYHFSHASRLSILIILNLFYLKLNHYFLFHLARHHQKKLIVMIVMLILKVSPGKFFCSVPNSFTCLLFA